MKTTKILIAAILVLLTASTFAQMSEGNYLTANFSTEMNHVEALAYNIREHFVHSTADEVDVIFEDESYIEDWMSTPFEDEIFEENLYLELWMSTPFETEENIEVEEWMTEALWK